jgi:acetylornithine/succinyldiaminopimelate/putrescine aminotransferase
VVMDAWRASTGEAIHTQTFLGNPVGCAMALASLEELAALTARARRVGDWFAAEVMRVPGVTGVTGAGLMRGVLVPDALARTRRMLDRGYIVLPAGERAEVLGFTPPLTITEAQLAGAIEAMR